MTRRRLFPTEPIAELRGLSSLTDPEEVGGVIDVAVFGARGDGKTQFIVHAIRTLRAHAPMLDEAERGLNRDVLRVVLDPRAPRPEATPPGFVPHYTFRVRPSSVLSRLRSLAALRLLWRAAPRALAITALAFCAGLACVVALGQAPSVRGLGLCLAAAGVTALAALATGRAARRAPELEVAFWDIAGEHVYSASAADYYGLLAALIHARKQRAAELGRPYTFAPVLLCNPIALGTREAASPFERLRQLLPLFAAIDDRGGRALIAVNRWSVVDPICARGALRDELVEVTAQALDEQAASSRQVARDLVRKHCLDTEEGRDGDVTISVLRYDTALRATVRPAAPSGAAPQQSGGASPDALDDEPRDDETRWAEASALVYRYDEGPGSFVGDTASRFLDWLLRGLRPVEPTASAQPTHEAHQPPPAQASIPPVPQVPHEAAPAPAGAAAEAWARRQASESRTMAAMATLPALGPPGPRRDEPATAEVWARPADSATLPGGLAGGSGGAR